MRAWQKQTAREQVGQCCRPQSDWGLLLSWWTDLRAAGVQQRPLVRPRLRRRPLVGLPGLGIGRELLPRLIVCAGSLARAIACTDVRIANQPPRVRE